jgi:phosphoheptose isomerase
MIPTAGATVRERFAQHASLVAACREALVDDIAAAAGHVAKALRSGRKIMACGNGGSAADAQHFAAELVGRFVADRRALPGLALTTDSSSLTAISNDFGFVASFARQVEGLAQPGDVLVAISTSGSSPNVLAAAQAARRLGCIVVGLIGRDGGALKALCDCAVVVPSDETARIQEIHILVLHCLCELADVAVADEAERPGEER